mgnify:CR=1 FL=1
MGLSHDGTASQAYYGGHGTGDISWGPLMGTGYDRNVIHTKTLRSVVEYIHANPVRRGLVEYPEEWRWSSALDWSGEGIGPVPLDIESFPML